MRLSHYGLVVEMHAVETGNYQLVSAPYQQIAGENPSIVNKYIMYFAYMGRVILVVKPQPTDKRIIMRMWSGGSDTHYITQSKLNEYSTYHDFVLGELTCYYNTLGQDEMFRTQDLVYGRAKIFKKYNKDCK